MKEKGITLIALVVTIVVLLILAGVSISMLTGENGIITRAEESSIKNDNGAVLEGIKLKLADYYAQYKGELQEDKINLLKADGIIDNNCIVNVPKLLEKKLSTGNGSGRKDVYLIENNHLYYLDKNEEATDLGDLGNFDNDLETTDPSYFEISDDGTITLKDYEDYYNDKLHDSKCPYQLENIVIPSEVRGITVTKIGKGFCSHYKYVKTIYIPDTVTSIGDMAFTGCINLERVRMSPNISDYDGNPYKQCTGCGAVTKVKNENVLLASFMERYMLNKSQEELEELILKTYSYTGTYEEFLQDLQEYDIDFNQEAEDAGMKYIEYIKNILVNAENSWLRVEYAVYNNGGAEKTIEELEQMFVEKNGGTGNFDNFLVQEGMSREDFNNMIKEQGFRTEEDFLKVFIYLQ